MGHGSIPTLLQPHSLPWEKGMIPLRRMPIIIKYKSLTSGLSHLILKSSNNDFVSSSEYHAIDLCPGKIANIAPHQSGLLAFFQTTTPHMKHFKIALKSIPVTEDCRTLYTALSLEPCEWACIGTLEQHSYCQQCSRRVRINFLSCKQHTAHAVIDIAQYLFSGKFALAGLHILRIAWRSGPKACGTISAAYPPGIKSSSYSVSLALDVTPSASHMALNVPQLHKFLALLM